MTDSRKTTVNVKLTSVDLATKKGKFVLTPSGSDPLPAPSGPNQTLTFENEDKDGVIHDDGVEIDFVLEDATRAGYAFPPDNLKAKAVSSQRGATDLCPPQGTSKVFIPKKVFGPNNNTLKVLNPNKNKWPTGPDLTGPFSYVLWVTKGNSGDYIALDPGGTNMNGSTKRSPSTAAIVTTAVIAAVAVFALYKLNVFRT